MKQNIIIFDTFPSESINDLHDSYHQFSQIADGRSFEDSPSSHWGHPKLPKFSQNIFLLQNDSLLF